MHLHQPQFVWHFGEYIIPQTGENISQATFQVWTQFRYHFFGILIQKHIQWGAEHFVAVEQVLQVDSHSTNQECYFHVFDVDYFLLGGWGQQAENETREKKVVEKVREKWENLWVKIEKITLPEGIKQNFYCRYTDLWLLSDADFGVHRTFDVFHRHGNIAVANNRQQQDISFQIVCGIDAQLRDHQIKVQYFLLEIQTEMAPEKTQKLYVYCTILYEIEEDMKNVLTLPG